jgi:hypothetical protein
MFARRVSIFLSALALGLMVLACSLVRLGGDSDQAPEAISVVATTAVSSNPDVNRRCNALDRQMDHCSDALDRLYKPPVPTHYPEKLRQLIAIKKRYQLEQEAARACHCTPDAPVAGEALDACISRPNCDDFARCVAESLDDL